MENLGIPSATIVSEEFAAMSEASAREHGYDGLPLVTVPQAFDRLNEEEVRELAGKIAGDVIRVLVTPSEQLQEEFRDRWHTSGGHTVVCSIRTTLVAAVGAV
jgi:hypothetical protein